MEWYRSQCDGDWEHQFGVRIETIDNPGWTLEVDLAETELAGKLHDLRSQIDDELDWLHVTSDGKTFRAAGGPLMLTNAVRAFLDFADVTG